MQQQDTSLETLKEIRNIMDRSSRFLSLSGWSGIWAGVTALAGAGVAYSWLQQPSGALYTGRELSRQELNSFIFEAFTRYILLAMVILAVALAGGLFFTWRKTRRQGLPIWNNSSRQLVLQAAIPLAAGGVFCFAMLWHNIWIFVAPACLVFYGLALINASKYTISDIRYLGLLEVALGCINLFFPGYSLYFWALGFGVLHILYGIIMWNKYDKQ